MNAMEALLKKTEARKNKSFVKFKPTTHRAWDYSSKSEKKEQDTATKENGNKYGNNMEKNRNESGNSREQIWEQNRNESGNNREQIWEQNRNESGNKYGNNIVSQEENLPGNETNTQDTKIFDTKYSVEEVILKTLCSTCGYQNEIMRHITKHIKSLPEKTYSVDISIEILSKKINADKESTRVSLKRLQKKKILIRMKGERGRHGLTKFIIPEFVVKKCFSIFDDIPFDINDIGNKYGNKYGNSEIHTSSSSFINTTTTEMTESTITCDELKNIDIEPLGEIGFSTQHLSQLTSQKKLSTDVIQESINAFAFDLKENGKAKSIKGLPLNFFMGVLGKGKPYLPPPNYESPEDRDIRLYIERKKELEKVRLEREEELLRLACGEWVESLTEEEKQAVMSEDAKKSSVQGFKMASLRTYFKENLWTHKRAEFLGSVG